MKFPVSDAWSSSSYVGQIQLRHAPYNLSANLNDTHVNLDCDLFSGWKEQTSRGLKNVPPITKFSQNPFGGPIEKAIFPQRSSSDGSPSNPHSKSQSPFSDFQGSTCSIPHLPPVNVHFKPYHWKHKVPICDKCLMWSQHFGVSCTDLWL